MFSVTLRAERASIETTEVLEMLTAENVQGLQAEMGIVPLKSEVSW